MFEQEWPILIVDDARDVLAVSTLAAARADRSRRRTDQAGS
jgi:hypothetical protein